MVSESHFQRSHVILRMQRNEQFSKAWPIRTRVMFWWTGRRDDDWLFCFERRV